VCSAVHGQVVALCEGLAADVASERLLARVRSAVSVQVAACREGLVADVAREGLLARVRPAVYVQVARKREARRAAALRARVRLRVPVLRSPVPRESICVSETLPAAGNVALEHDCGEERGQRARGGEEHTRSERVHKKVSRFFEKRTKAFGTVRTLSGIHSICVD
jgi:hypothetical protein